MTNVTTCPQCHGTGQIIEEPCRDCRGTGKVRKSTTLEVDIPAGIDHGQTMQLSQKGEPGERGGPNGDLLITIRIKPHEMFRRDGFDVYMDLPVTFVQAAVGATVKVPTLDGVVEYDIPEGPPPGAVFRLRGKGIPHIRGKMRGDQYVTVDVEVPKGLTNKQKELLKEFEAISEGKNYKKQKSFVEKMREFLK